MAKVVNLDLETCCHTDAEDGSPVAVWGPVILQDIEKDLGIQPDILANGLAIASAQIKEWDPFPV